MNNKLVLSGNLAFLNLGELIQLFGSSGSTGVLRIISKYIETPGMVYFSEGNPLDASTGETKGLDALYSLFGWSEGEFEFSEESIKKKDVIKKSRMEIILDGLRMVDDGEIEKLGNISYEKTKGPSGDRTLPVIKGPMPDYMCVVDEEEFHDGSVIVTQGSHGSWIWVVLDGVVEIRKEMPGKDPLPIIRIGSGSFIGNITALLYSGNLRSATVVAIGDVHLGVIDSQMLSSEYTCLSSEFKNVLLSLDKRLRQVTEKAVEVYNNIEKPIDLKDKEQLIKQDSSDNSVYRIKQGQAYVVRKTKKGSIVLSELEKGDFIGHLPFANIGHEPNSASIYISEDTEVEPVDLDELQNQYFSLTATLKDMTDNFVTFLSATTTITCDLYNKGGKKEAINEGTTN
ncbi:MAG: cyclic nucleotide-binding domain-containing protein [Desulfobacterales bacterium]|nr:cyclic nucleotide-binding domain-containing protein [Desulfobacteraceae bacterium]MBT7084749.1 cyclic nucleotide-binding domain-containing protein [Desulfobacterales bacterium]MBT7697907.1 cyclic nucleotide-binding domain-containing protein [Desulfobacterales bacterium]